jgi:hypothetical protein
MEQLQADYSELQQESEVYAQKIVEYQEMITDKERQASI